MGTLNVLLWAAVSVHTDWPTHQLPDRNGLWAVSSPGSLLYAAVNQAINFGGGWKFHVGPHYQLSGRFFLTTNVVNFVYGADRKGNLREFGSLSKMKTTKRKSLQNMKQTRYQSPSEGW